MSNSRRPRKVIRTKTLYKRHRFPKKAAGRILFFLLVAALIGVGYIIMREWSMRFGKDAKPPVSSAPPVSSQQPVSSQEEVSSIEEEKSPALQAEYSAYVSAEELLQNKATLPSFMQEIKAQGYTAVTIELKPVSGMLAYSSKAADAVKYGAVTENADTLLNIIKAVKDAGLTPIASISTLKDQSLPHVSRNNSYAYSTQLSTNWLDDSLARDGKPWLNPYMDAARSYLCEIAKEIDTAGFKIIILENVMFPDKNTKGMNTILTEPSREQILLQTVNEITAAAPNATVLRVLDMALVSAGEGTLPMNKAISEAGGKTPALRIDLARVEANKEAICKGAGIVGASGYDKAIPVEEVVKGVLEQTAKAGVPEQGLAVIASKADCEKLKAVFEELSITQIIEE